MLSATARAALDKANRQINRAFDAPAPTPAENAAHFLRLAHEALSSMRASRERDVWCDHLMRGISRRHAALSLELAALYRRRAASAFAKTRLHPQAALAA